MPLNPRTGNYGLASRLNQALELSDGYRPWPGYRHPCRYDGVFQLCSFPSSRLGMGFLKLQLPEERPSRSLQEKGSQAGALVVIHK